MMFARACVLLFLLCVSVGGGAQPAPQDPAGAQRLLDGMRSVAGARRVDEEAIIRLQNMGLPRTAANVAKVTQLLAARGEAATTVGLIRLLATLYVPNASSQANGTIVRTLKSYIYGTDPMLATEALLAYSRTGAHATLLAELDYGLQRGLLDENGYCQELAINLPVLPAPLQYEAALRLRAKNNEFGIFVLVGGINRRETIARMLPRTRDVLESFLAKNEPAMPQAIGEFSAITGLTYAGWLETMALLSEARGKNTYLHFIFGQLERPDADPRKALAYLSSPDGARFMQAVGSRAVLAPLVERAREPARHFPGSSVFDTLTDQMNAWLDRLKDQGPAMPP